MKDEIVTLNTQGKEQISNREEKCREEEEEEKLTEEFEAQASVFLLSCIYGCKFFYAIKRNINI